MPCVVHFSKVASNPAGEYIRSGGPEPITSYRVRMPSMIAVAKMPFLPGCRAFNLTRGTYIFRIRGERLQSAARDIGIGFDFGVQRAGGVTDRGMRHAQPSIQPRSAAHSSEYRN